MLAHTSFLSPYLMPIGGLLRRRHQRQVADGDGHCPAQVLREAPVPDLLLTALEPADPSRSNRSDGLIPCTILSDWAEKADDSNHLKWIRDAYESVYRRWGGVPDPFKGPPMDKTKPVDESPFEGCYYSADPPPSNLLRTYYY